ncbi:MAG: hypothetical protein FJ191_10720 [Gammaproteobacteria bacterium]|nr:hypothetical protein [Gammaproteobacteria bacterium]
MASAALGRLEELLRGVYDLELDCRVEDFVVTDRGLLPAACRGAPGDEQLVVAAGDDELGLALFLDPALLRRLQARDPSDGLTQDNVADCWAALEGISHFLCVAHHAAHDREVSLLTLELQAEVDKYVGSLLLLRRHDPRRFPAELHTLLFRKARIDPLLAGTREPLYRRASGYAARFCALLEPALRRGRAGAHGAFAQLRRFYRMSDTAKLRHIDALAPA